MRRGKAGGFFLILLALGLPVHSAEAGAAETADTAGNPLILSPDEAVRRALDSSLNLKKSLIDLSGAEYRAKRLWSELFPAITGSAGTGYSSALFTGDGFSADEKNVGFSTGLGITLGFNAGIPYAMKNIRLAYQARLLSYEDARSQLEIQVIKNFYGLIADRENLNFLEETLKLAEQQLDKNRIAFNNGLVRELVVLQGRLGVETARYNLSAARSAYLNGMGEFLALLGVEPDTEALLEGNMDVVRIEADPELLVRDYLPRRPDIMGRRQEIERLENAEKQTLLSSKAPSLSLSARWEGRDIDPFADVLSGTASVNIPIDPWIPGTAKDQALRTAKADVEKAKLDLKSAEDSAAAQIRSLAANLRNSWDSIEIARLSLEVAERTHELAEQGFRNGTVESLSLEDARNSLADARQRLLRSKLAYQTMTLDLAAALNINWKDFLNNPPGTPPEIPEAPRDFRSKQ
ncbi:MAG: TolC family protein [Treponema sp.]|nr:TolC family protein [Treponema sp.]